MIKSGGSVKNVINKFSNLSNLEMVETLVEESEDIITRLQQGVSEINEKHRSYAGEALKDMIFIKLQLKTSRISLNDLAQRTMFAVADLKAVELNSSTLLKNLVLLPELIDTINHFLDQLNLGVSQSVLVGDVVSVTCLTTRLSTSTT